MLYLHDLRAKLQDRKNRLYKVGVSQYETELRFFLQFLDDNPCLRALVHTLDADKSIDFGEWCQTDANRHEVRFPPSELGRAKMCYEILKLCAFDPKEEQSIHWGMRFTHETQSARSLEALNEEVLQPFVNFLHDRIDEAGGVLYLIERFKIKVEWFRKHELFSLYTEDTSRGEDSLDRKLRESLFEGGIDYPFSQPLSPSGQADIIALLGSDDPLVMEVKVFDPGKGRSKRHIQQGFHQVLKYADDYNQPVGYLVVFNCSDGHLVFQPESNGEHEFPTRVTHAGKTFFLISIDLQAERPSASKDRPATRTEISYEELTGQ